MGFLDQTGLSYFYTKLKEKFVQSINAITPDENGNVEITRVATAENLVSPDGQTTFDTYIYRTTGGSASIKSGPAQLLYIDGNCSISNDRTSEEITLTANNNLQASINAAIWRTTDYGQESGTYTFSYDSETTIWTPNLVTYGISVSGIHTSSLETSVSGTITSVSVTKATWETQITTSGTYFFEYDGTNWKLNSVTVDLATYGIALAETPTEGDVITVIYTAATPDSAIVVNYVKENRGTIFVATPTGFSATGFNQFDKESMVLTDMTISNGHITSQEGKYLCYCKAVGGVTNGYVAYSANGVIENIGWCASLPQESGEVTTTGQTLTATVASITFNNNGYVVVVVTDPDDLCIHPKWSGRADTTYSDYVAPSTITFPTTGTLDETTVSLPIGSYGMPALNGVADRLDLYNGKYIKKIGRYPYSAENLATVQNMGVYYDYDSTNIFYVLSEPITYNISISSTYTANDFGTEEFLGTTLGVPAQNLYEQNLVDKLRTDVLTISPQTLTAPQQLSVYNNLALYPIHFSGEITAFPYTLSDERILSTMSIANVVFGNEGNITSDIEWETTTGSVTFTGTLATGTTTTIEFDATPTLSITSNTTFDADEIVAQYNAVLTSIQNELQQLQADAAVELKKLQFNNIVVATSAFISDETYSDYGYKVVVPLTNVIANMTPDVMLSMDDATSGVFSPIAECYNGGVYLYANDVPESGITIPTIICWRANA